MKYGTLFGGKKIRSTIIINAAKIFNLKARFKNRLKSLFRYFINSKFYIFSIKKIYKIHYIFFILRSLEKKLDKFGFRIYNYQFVRKSKKLKEDLELVTKNYKYLETYFTKSEDAKNILTEHEKKISNLAINNEEVDKLARNQINLSR